MLSLGFSRLDTMHILVHRIITLLSTMEWSTLQLIPWMLLLIHSTMDITVMNLR